MKIEEFKLFTETNSWIFKHGEIDLEIPVHEEKLTQEQFSFMGKAFESIEQLKENAVTYLKHFVEHSCPYISSEAEEIIVTLFADSKKSIGKIYLNWEEDPYSLWKVTFSWDSNNWHPIELSRKNW